MSVDWNNQQAQGQRCGQCSSWYWGQHICGAVGQFVPIGTGTAAGWLYPAYVTAADIRKIVREEIAAALAPKAKKRK